MVGYYWLNSLEVTQVTPDHAAKINVGGSSTTISEFIDKNIPELANGATDTLSPLLFNGHLQTAYTALATFESIDQVNYKRIMLKYPDGGVGALDFAMKEPDNKTEYVPEGQTPLDALNSHMPGRFYTYMDPNDARLRSNDSKPLLIALHGLTGGSHESYVRSMVRTLQNKYDFEACVLNSRGCCNSAITTAQLYNGGWTNDIRHCVKELREMYPNRKFYMIGFSLGASILTNYLGEQGDKSDIELAIAFGTPFDLSHSAKCISESRIGSRVYSPKLTQNLLRLVKSHEEELTKNEKFRIKYESYAANLKSVTRFDDLFTGPMFGYRDAEDYYQNSSSYRRLLGIRTPYIAINSADDPIVGYQALHENMFRANPYTTLIRTSIGGHIAWFKDMKGDRWYTEPACKLIADYHSKIASQDHAINVNINDLPKESIEPVKTTYRDDL